MAPVEVTFVRSQHINDALTLYFMYVVRDDVVLRDDVVVRDDVIARDVDESRCL